MSICAWLRRRNTQQHESDIRERAARTEDVSARLREQRKENGFGKMFDSALHAPPRREGKTP